MTALRCLAVCTVTDEAERQKQQNKKYGNIIMEFIKAKGKQAYTCGQYSIDKSRGAWKICKDDKPLTIYKTLTDAKLYIMEDDFKTRAYTLAELEVMKVSELNILAKEYKAKNWWKIKKVRLIAVVWRALPLNMKPVPKMKNQQQEELAEAMEDFVENGGKVKECRPQRNGKRRPPTMSSAEKNFGAKKRKSKKSKGEPRKSRVKRVREDDNIVTLQTIINGLNLAGALARKALRASGIQKPGKQWCWDKGSKDLKTVQDLMEFTKGLSSSIKKGAKK